MKDPRPATPEDTQGILNLVSEVYAEYGLVLRAEEEEPYLLEAGEYFRASGGEFWVVEEDGEIRATVAARLDDDSGELKTLYVHESLRKRGLGRELVELTTSHVRQAGKEKMVLWSDTRFADAHRLYESCGFTQDGLRDLEDSNDSWEYGFTRDLTTP